MKHCVKHDELFEKKCKSCNREYQRKWFAENKEKQVSRVIRNRNSQKAKLRKILVEHFAENPCIDCGEADPIVLDFDHRDPSTKYKAVSEIYSNGMTAKRLREEIDKCDVRCANCHRRKTAKDFQNWRYLAFGERL